MYPDFEEKKALCYKCRKMTACEIMEDNGYGECEEYDELDELQKLQSRYDV